MAVIRNPYGVRQRNPLVDELLKKAQAESSNITPAQYTAESYGGRFPIGSLTADILSGVRERNIRKEAEQASAEERDALSKLMQVRGDPEKYQVDASGNITTTSLMPKEEVEGFDISQLGRTGTYNPAQTGSGVMLDQSLANTMGTSQEDDAQNLAIALRAAEARKTTGTPASQLEQDMLTEKTTPVTFTYGAEKDPNFLDRMLGKSLRKEEISNINDLAIKAGISPFDLQKYDAEQQMRQEAFELKKKEFATKEKQAADKSALDQLNLVAKRLEIEGKNIANTKNYKELEDYNQKKTYVDLINAKATELGLEGEERADYLARNFAKKGYFDLSEPIDKRIFKSKETKEGNIAKYRKEEKATFKPLKKGIDNYKKLRNALQGKTGTDAYAAMISFIKNLDDSVVREGEVAAFGSFQGIFVNVKREFAKAQGENMPESMRTAILKLATENINNQINDYNMGKSDAMVNFYGKNDYTANDIYSGLTFSTENEDDDEYKLDSLLGNNVEDWRNF